MKCTYRLWMAADGDLLNGRASYRLLNTGQGLNRVQQCPSVSKEMRDVLMAAKGGCENGWIGLSVVHLGDRDVPNALTFIDKYAQIPGMLLPVVSTINAILELNRDHNVKVYVEQVLGGERATRLHILTDFFKHAFDGDGDDGGSCIDGRITSCWNWCSKISSKLSAAEDIAKRAKDLKADFPLDWTTDSDETRAYIDYVRLFQYVESLEMLLPSLKVSFDRADDGSELVPISGLDGPSLRAYSGHLRELQICRDDLLACRSMNNNKSEAQQQPSIYLSQSDVLSCPTPTGGQVSDQSSTNVVARKRRLGISSSNLQKSKLEPGGGAVMTSEVVAADILDLTGQLKASAGEVNSTLKTQTAILEKTGEEALQNVERVKRETDKVGAHLSKKRRNLFATFSAMAMALASFCAVYIFIIMPFGRKRTFSSHIAPLLFSSTKGDHGGGLGLQTVHHVVPSRDDENGEYATMNNNDFLMKDEDFLDGSSVVVGGEEENDESLRTLPDFNSLVEGGDDSDACDEEHHVEILLQNLTDFESEAGVDGGEIVDSFEKIDEFMELFLHKSDEVVKNIDGMFEATKNLHEPKTVGDEGSNLNFGIEVKKYADEKSEEVVVVEPPDVVEETETETKQNECFVNLGDGPPNMSKEEEASIPNEEGDDEVVTEGQPPYLIVEKGAEILLDSSSAGEGGPGASEEAEEILKGIDVHLEGTIETNQNSDDPVDDAVSLENAKKFPPVSKNKNEGIGNIQFQDDAVAEDNENNTEACVPNGANGEAAATVKLKNAVEFINESNKFDFHETQQDVTPSTTKEGREKEDVPEEDDNSNVNDNDDEAIKNSVMSEEEERERTQVFLKEKFQLERAKLQEAIEKFRAGVVLLF